LAQAKVTTDLIVRDRNLQAGLSRAQTSIQKFGKAASLVTTSMIALWGSTKLVGAFKTIISLALDQERAVTKLNAVLKATGNVTGFTTEQFEAMASEMQATSEVGDEVILNAQGILATFKNIRGDNFREATQAALDMTAVLDTDLNGAMLQLGKALNDPIKSISVVPILVVNNCVLVINVLSFHLSNFKIDTQFEIAFITSHSTAKTPLSFTNRCSPVAIPISKTLVIREELDVAFK